LENRVQYAYVWSSILTKTDIAHLYNRFEDKGNAVLIGYDLKRLYGTCFQQTTGRPLIQLLLTWLPEETGPEFKSNVITRNDLCDKKKIHKTVHIPRSQITLTIRECNYCSTLFLDNLEAFVQKGDLETNIMFLKGDTSLHEATLRLAEHGPASGYTIYETPLDANLFVGNNLWRDISLGFQIPHRTGTVLH
jgi:hypothetical protein